MKDKICIELTHSEWMALSSLIAQHLICPNAVEVYVDCSTADAKETSSEELLALVMDARLVKGSATPAEPDPEPDGSPIETERRGG